MPTPAYEKEILRQIKFKLNRKYDADMLTWLEQQDNIQGYIKSLIRADMKNRGSKMFEKYYITAESFGDEVPKNWEEIADYLNEKIEAALNSNPGLYFEPGHDASGLSAEGHDLLDKIWEDYCSGDYPDAPQPVME